MLKKSIIILTAILLLVLITTFIIFSKFSFGINNNVEYSKSSNDDKYTVYVYERSSGATSGFSTQISVIKKSKKIGHKSGNLFIADRGNAVLSDFGTIKTKVEWIDQKTILITYDKKARIFKNVNKIWNLDVKYQEE